MACGRCCGCALGKPVESWPFMAGKDGVPGWKLVYEWFKGANAYPIKDYVPSKSTASEKYGINLIMGAVIKRILNIWKPMTISAIQFLG